MPDETLSVQGSVQHLLTWHESRRCGDACALVGWVGWELHGPLPEEFHKVQFIGLFGIAPLLPRAKIAKIQLPSRECKHEWAGRL